MESNDHEIEIRSESYQDVINKSPAWLVRWGSMIILITIALLLVGTWLIKYPDIIRADILLTTENPPQKSYARISADIDSILVKQGDTVKQSDLVLILESTAIWNDVLFLEKIIDTIKVSKKAIHFPFESIPVLFLGEIDPYFATFENSYFQYTLDKNLDPFSSQIEANKISIREMRRRLNGVISQRNISERELQLKKRELDRYQTLFDKGTIAEQELELKQAEYFTEQRKYENLGLSISQLRESIGNAENTTSNTDYEKSREEIRLLKNVLQAFNELRNAIKEWELKHVIRAEIDGIVYYSNIWSRNQTVSTGDLVCTILPLKESNLIAKADLPSLNAGKAKKGQRVNIDLFDYPKYEFGVLQGNVSKISAVSDADGFYTMDISIPKMVTSSGDSIIFRQEMKGKADIITEDVRLINRILYQFRDLFVR